ncbi:RING-H2 finger protein ATL39-like [Olea europaea var. sylvestris]|uniref:RING-H2 finger protein ATL39-like n=1 Tax=Olea europaea var. sylvestris TaxID=158386 RepID=UPI000C1CEFB7|nr:RING-H2 finger protein ATL39-like [Olea europaea var. sylvestris]
MKKGDGKIRADKKLQCTVKIENFKKAAQKVGKVILSGQESANKMPDILYLLPFVFTSTVIFLLIQYLLKKRENRYAESVQNELPVVNRQPSPPPPSSPTLTRSQMTKGRTDEIVVDIYIEQEGGDHECSICLFEFKDQELVRCLPACNHRFHFECIKTWLDISQTCPLCHQGTVIEP